MGGSGGNGRVAGVLRAYAPVCSVDPTRPVPVGAFGLTARPDELLHLVMDALERRATPLDAQSAR